jgi:hypothetical protein
MVKKYRQRFIHCEEMQDFSKWMKKEKKGASIYDCIGFYYPEVTKKGKVTGKWEVICMEGGYTCNSQFQAEVVSSLEQIKAMMLKKRKKSDVNG